MTKIDEVRAILDDAWRSTPLEERMKKEWVVGTFQRIREVTGAPDQGTVPKIGPGDAAYILAWCAWRAAEKEAYEKWSEDESRQRFIRWWNGYGSFQLEQYGLRILDTPGGSS